MTATRPRTERRKLRDKASVILTNPDMLHQGILPQHARWNKFFSNLRFVVLDEVHSYRGVFGSHLANVMRRLKRICAHYGSDPHFICCSATIANPREHAESITGSPMELVDNDGSPKGPKKFVFWNPPMLADQKSAGVTYDAGRGEEKLAVGGGRADVVAGEGTYPDDRVRADQADGRADNAPLPGVFGRDFAEARAVGAGL